MADPKYTFGTDITPGEVVVEVLKQSLSLHGPKDGDTDVDECVDKVGTTANRLLTRIYGKPLKGSKARR